MQTTTSSHQVQAHCTWPSGLSLVSGALVSRIVCHGHNGKRVSPNSINCAVYGPHLRRQQVLFQCNNQRAVPAISNGYLKEPPVMRLTRRLRFLATFFDVSIVAEHIAGAINYAADTLSGNNMINFYILRHVVYQPPLPALLMDIIAPTDQTGYRLPSAIGSAILYKRCCPMYMDHLLCRAATLFDLSEWHSTAAYTYFWIYFKVIRVAPGILRTCTCYYKSLPRRSLPLTHDSWKIRWLHSSTLPPFVKNFRWALYNQEFADQSP